MTTEIKVYVANLGKYNEGELVGNWFTLPHDIEDIRVQIGVAHYDHEGTFVPYVSDGLTMYEEWAIHDYEAPFKIEEYSSLDKLNEIAERLDNCTETEEVIKAILGNYSDKQEALDILENNEFIVYNNCQDMGDVAREALDMTCMLEGQNEILVRYFDYDAYGRDLEIEGTFLQADSDTYVEITR